MSVTIYDVANLAHVSVTTISKILNHKDFDISAETRQRVLGVIKELNFVPSGLARSLVTKKTNTLALLLPSITNQYFAEIARGVENGASSLGYNVFLCNTDESHSKEIEYLNVLKERLPDGVIMVPVKGSDKMITDEFEFSVPFILLDRTYEEMKDDIYCVRFDNIKGGYIATKHLLENGHKRIGIICGPVQNKPSNDRLAGYKMALSEAGVEFDEDLVCYGDYDLKSGKSCAKTLIEKNATALFCTNDMMACGSYKAIREKGLKVYEDISVVGYDNISLCDLVEPPLTTVMQPKLKMGRVATQNLIKMINKQPVEKDVMFKPELVLRKSVKCIK